MAYTRRLQILRWRPTLESITLTGTGFTALANTPYRVIEVLGPTVTVTDQSQTLTQAWYLYLGFKEIIEGTLVIRTATGGGGLLLSENTDYRVDYEGGRVQLVGSTYTAGTYYCSFQYRTATYTRSTDGGSTGDYYVDTTESTAQGIRRITGSAIGDGATVLVRYFYATVLLDSSLNANANLISAEFNIQGIGGCADGMVVIQAPEIDTRLIPFHTEARAYYDGTADYPDSPRWLGRLRALPMHDGVSRMTLKFEGVSEWLKETYAAPGNSAGITYTGGLTAQLLSILKAYGPAQIVIDESLIDSSTESVSFTIQEESIGEIVDTLALMAASDENGVWVWGVRPDGKFYFLRRPTTVLASFRHGVSGATTEWIDTNYKPLTKVMSRNPDGSRRVFEHPRTHVMDDDLYKYQRATSLVTPGWVTVQDAIKVSVGLMEETARNRIAFKASVFEGGVTEYRPEQGTMRMYDSAGSSMGVAPLQHVHVSFGGTYDVEYRVGYTDDRPAQRQHPATVAGETPNTTLPLYKPFAAVLLTGTDPNFTFAEIDPDGAAQIAGGRSGSCVNIGPVAASIGENALVQEDEGGFRFFC